jgi:hypothetical protein
MWALAANDSAPEGAIVVLDQIIQPLRTKLLRSALVGWLDYGWQPYEKVTEQLSDGNWGISKLKPLIQDFTDILVDKNTGALMGCSQEIDSKEVKLDLDHSVVLSFDFEGTDWYGMPVMKNCETAYDKWEIIEAAAERYDRKVAGSSWIVYYPLGKSPLNGVDTDNAEIAQRILKSLESSGMVALPSSLKQIIETEGTDEDARWKIELLSDGSAGRGAFTERQKYLDALKVRGVGIPERSVLEGQFGTKAEAEAHADFAILNVELMLQIIVEQVNEQVTDHLLRVNYGPEAQGTVYIEPPQLTDSQAAFMRKIYEMILTNPESGELLNVDVDSMRDDLGVPYQPQPEGIGLLPGPLDPSPASFLGPGTTKPADLLASLRVV